MSRKQAEATGSQTVVIKTKDPNYCGEGAGGVQFAYGRATVPEGWIANWYRGRPGYTVEMIEDEAEDPPAE